MNNKTEVYKKARRFIFEAIKNNEDEKLQSFLSQYNIVYIKKIQGELFSSILLKDCYSIDNKSVNLLKNDISKKYYSYIKRQLSSKKQEKLGQQEWIDILFDFKARKTSLKIDFDILKMACKNNKYNFVKAFQTIKEQNNNQDTKYNAYQVLSIFSDPNSFNEDIKKWFLNNGFSDRKQVHNCLNYAISAMNYKMVYFILKNKKDWVINQAYRKEIDMKKQAQSSANVMRHIWQDFMFRNKKLFDLPLEDDLFTIYNIYPTFQDPYSKTNSNYTIDPFVYSSELLMFSLENNQPNKKKVESIKKMSSKQFAIFKMLNQFYSKNNLEIKTIDNKNILHILSSFNTRKQNKTKYVSIAQEIIKTNPELIAKEDKNKKSFAFLIDQKNIDFLMPFLDKLPLEQKNNKNQTLYQYLEHRFKNTHPEFVADIEKMNIEKNLGENSKKNRNRALAL